MMKKIISMSVLLIILLLANPLFMSEKEEVLIAPPEQVSVLDTSEMVTVTEKKWKEKYPEVYESIKEALKQFQPVMVYNTKEIDQEELDQMLSHIIDNHRTNTYLKEWEYWELALRDEGEVHFTYSLPRDEIIAQEQFIKEEVARLADELVTSQMSEGEIVRAFHDYIVLHTAYDEHAAETCGESDCYDPAYSAYGLLKNGDAVCEGYAQVLTLLLDAVGIENYYVQGDAGDELHAWNLVKVDGHYYYIDTTWDDPAPDEEGVVYDDYFLVSADELDDHHWKRDDYPKSAAHRYEEVAR